MRILPTAGNPVVYGEWLGAPGKPTVLVYGHYDVQPPDPLEKWHSPPWTPTVRDGRLYARGVSDDKGPMLIPIAVAEAFFATAGRLPVNIKFMFEGEEEIGSRHLDAFVQQHKELLAADVVVSADGAMWRIDEPSLTVASRGLCGLELTLTAASKDLHSGRHGGGVANPLHAMAALIASLHESDGRVAVAGFYDEVRELSSGERAAIAALPYDERAYLAQVGAPSAFGEPGYTTLERQWTRPTLEVNGMWGGYQGPGQKTVIPSEAHAKITCRLVPDQDPDEVAARVRRHLEAHVPPGVRLSLSLADHGSRAAHIAADHFALKAADAALQATYGVRPLVVRMGGTVPIAELFQRHMGLDTVFFSFSTADEDFHAPNEFFRVHRLHEGLEAWARYWDDPRRGERMTSDLRDASPDPAAARSAGLAQAEARVEAHSASLKKELGVRDLALTQILFIVGLTWIGVAGKLGPSHVVFWLLALVLFYLPSAAVVIYLNRLMPLEGGLYQWAKLGFNQTVGFMLAWNLWLYVIVFTSEIGLQCATYLSYAIGPSAAWMTSSSWFVALSSALILSLMVVTSTIGLSVGKWVHNTGGIFMITIFGAVVLLPVDRPAHRHARRIPSLPHAPSRALALQPEHPREDGLRRARRLRVHGHPGRRDQGAGAIRRRRSVFIAAPVIALMFVLGTSTVVAYVPTNDIDLIGPVAQVLRVGYGPFGIAAPLVTVAILMTLAMRVGQASVAFTAVTRLPMVAGWDHMLPAWFSRLHATYKTPVNSIMLVGAALVRDRVVEPHRRRTGGGVSARCSTRAASSTRSPMS